MIEDKTKNGIIQVKNGKMRMRMNDEWRDFGPLFIASDMRRIAKPVSGRTSAYAVHLKHMASLLESEGMAAISPVQKMLKLFFGCREYWMQRDCKVWHNWLQQIWQFRNCTEKKDEPAITKANKNYRNNFEKAFELI